MLKNILTNFDGHMYLPILHLPRVQLAVQHLKEAVQHQGLVV